MDAYWNNYAAAEYNSHSSQLAGKPPDGLRAWFQAQLAWVQRGITAYETGGGQVEGAGGQQGSALFWKGMQRLMWQFDGLVAGYEQSCGEMDVLTIYMLNSVGDLEDLNTLFANTSSSSSSSSFSKPPAPESTMMTDCSAMFRVLPDGSDIVAAHVTWRRYYAMLRVYKTYRFAFTGLDLISMSSSPGLLHSKDDFYTTDSLVVVETTNSIFNTTLYNAISTSTALSWQRAMVANTLARSGKEWTDLFAMYNSGTYNNQWMVLDVNLTRSYLASSLSAPSAAAGLFWIVEQVPSITQAKDVSPVLIEQGYWGSYNIPYFKNIYDVSGYPAQEAKYGDSFSYQRCPRAQIFRRNHSAVTSFEDVQAIMRYNQWKSDPLSLGDPGNAVASRFDLNAKAPAAFGGIDAKVASGKQPQHVVAISGPTHAQMDTPPCDWSSFPVGNIKHALLPQKFSFDWITIDSAFN
jgi:hypothetical protein